MNGWSTADWALFVSFASAGFAGLSWLLHARRAAEDVARERGAIVRDYQARFERVEEKLRDAVSSGHNDDYGHLAASITLLTQAISHHFGWRNIPVKTAFGAYRRFVQTDDRVGIGLDKWMAEGYEAELETLRNELLARVADQLKDKAILERIREGVPASNVPHRV